MGETVSQSDITTARRPFTVGKIPLARALPVLVMEGWHGMSLMGAVRRVQPMGNVGEPKLISRGFDGGALLTPIGGCY